MAESGVKQEAPLEKQNERESLCVKGSLVIEQEDWNFYRYCIKLAIHHYKRPAYQHSISLTVSECSDHSV